MADLQYEILDDLEEDDDDDDVLDDIDDDGGDDVYEISDDDSEDGIEVPVEEIEAMLDEGVPNYNTTNEDVARVGGGGACARRRLKNAILADDGGDPDFQAPAVVEKIVLVGENIFKANTSNHAHTN